MKNIYEKRRSIYPAQYNQIPIENSQIRELLNAANWAPSHKKTEPWRFYVIQKTTLPKLGVFLSEKYKMSNPTASETKLRRIVEKIKQSSHIIIICMQRDPKESVPEWEEIAATAMDVQNMWLKATELKLGAYWSSPSTIQYMNEFLPMKSGERCLGLFYVGNFDGEYPEGERGSIDEKTMWL